MAAAKKATKKTTKKATAKRAPAKKGTAKNAKKKTTTTTAAASVGNVVVASKVKEAVKAGEVRMAGDFPEALNAEVQTVIARAIQRAKDNGRGTVRPNDL